MSRATDMVTELAAPIAEQFGCEIYDCVYRKEGKDYYLSVYLYKESGVSIDDCAGVSEALSAKLDEADIIKGTYFFEVSSPGIERLLKTARHYEISIGKLIEVKLFAALNGQKKFTGRLLSFSDDAFDIELQGGEKLAFSMSAASQVKVLFED